MACRFPQAPNLDTYWQNILGKVNAITDPPPGTWDPDVYYEPGSTDSDKVYCKQGGYLGSLINFDPLEHGIPPVQVQGEPDQWLALQVAREAMADAGYAELEEATRRRTGIILGRGATPNSGSAIPIQHVFIVPQTIEIIKSLFPDLSSDDVAAIRDRLRSQLPPMGPEAVAGLTPNVIAGRIANRLDLMGPSYTVDAACASSLVAVQHAVRDLRNGDCDLVLAGGSHVWTPVPMLAVFCQLGALSRREQIRPFDKDADGTILGEGIGMLVLKRLSDAERDADRIYAVIRGVGVASDGKANFVMAPRVEGEELAMRRAYEDAGLSPAGVELIEAHGTGTLVGDAAEIQSMTRVFGERVGSLPTTAIGSVKSMISHTIPAAGAASMIKIALSLQQKMLPPTLNCSEPNPRFELEKTPFYINTETRPWIHGQAAPRRAGVSAFGFGGINAHVVLEEYVPAARAEGSQIGQLPAGQALPVHRPPWESELFVLQAGSRAELTQRMLALKGFAERDAAEQGAAFMDLAYTLAVSLDGNAQAGVRIAIVASNFADLAQKLGRAAESLGDPAVRRIRDGSGIYFSEEPMAAQGKIAFMFPGEGSQYPNMLADLCLHFPEVRECFDRMDRLYAGSDKTFVPSDYIYPRPTFSAEEAKWAEEQLWDMDGAVASVLTADEALLTLLRGLKVMPDTVVGHSSGEYAALFAADALGNSGEMRADLSRSLMQVYAESLESDGIAAATLLAIGAAREQVDELLSEVGPGAHVAMDNCPHQVVLVATDEAVPLLMAAASRESLIVERLAFDRPYHTGLFERYSQRLRRALDSVDFRSPGFPLYSAVTCAPFEGDPSAIRDLVAGQWSRPVEFRRTIESLYDDGYRIFVEVGPRGNLTSFVEDTLRGRPHSAIASDVQRRSGVTQLNHLAGVLAVQGVPLDLAYLFRWRTPNTIDWQGDVTVPPSRREPTALRIGFPGLTMPADLAQRLRMTTPAHPPLIEPAAMQAMQPNGLPPPPDGAAAELVYPVDIRDSYPVPMDLAEAIEPMAYDLDQVPELASAHSFLETMEQFLDVQHRIMGAFLEPPAMPVDGAEGYESHLLDPQLDDRGGDPGPAGAGGPAAAVSDSYPLLGTISSWTTERIVARRQFDPETEPCLADHTIGRDISSLDSTLRGLPIMPLTLMLEMASEAAAALMPDHVVTGLRDVNAKRWLAFESGPRTLEVEARLAGQDKVQVQLRPVGADGNGAGASPAAAIVEVTVIMAHSYERAPAVEQFTVADRQASRFGAAALYGQEMFHGPAWQGVRAIQATGSNGIVATVEVLPLHSLLGEYRSPRFQLDPVMLDAAGQVLAFWTHEHLASGWNIFPFHIDEVDFHGGPRPAGDVLDCTAVICRLDTQVVSANIQLSDRSGGPWIVFKGWTDKRFYLQPALGALASPSGLGAVSQPWPELTSGLQHGPSLSCRRLWLEPPSDPDFLARIWSLRILSRSEREEFWRVTPGPERLARLSALQTAKEAVQELVQRHFGLGLLPPDIEIRTDDTGRLYASGTGLEQLPARIQVATVHSGEWTTALAGLVSGATACLDLGLYAVSAGAPVSESQASSQWDAGTQLLSALPAGQSRDEWSLRLWCARNAAIAALGKGEKSSPNSVRIETCDFESGLLLLTMGGPELMREGTPVSAIAVATATYDSFVVAATCVGNQSGS